MTIPFGDVKGTEARLNGTGNWLGASACHQGQLGDFTCCNHIAQTTPTGLALAGTIAARFMAFGIACQELDTSDVLEIAPAACTQIEAVRRMQVPRALVLNTERFGPHSKGDDTRPEAAVERLRQERDPLALHGARLDEPQRQAIQAEVQAEIAAALHRALEA